MVTSSLDRCHATSTCPKIFETLGSAEFWGLRGSPDFVGTDGHDIPLPPNVRRYYFPGTRHGGGSGAFTLAPLPVSGCVLSADEAPEWEQLPALLVDLTDWVVKGTAPPVSQYPRLADATLTTPDNVAHRFPRIPGDPGPAGLLNPFLDYDFGSGFDPVHMRGTIAHVPPVVRRVLPSWVPQIDQDGNEMAGLKSVLFANPLGTYTAWNISARGFTKGQPCGGGLTGGFVPFARTRAERIANGDPRPSLEERYGDEASYLRRVEETARRLMRTGCFCQRTRS